MDLIIFLMVINMIQIVEHILQQQGLTNNAVNQTANQSEVYSQNRFVILESIAASGQTQHQVIWDAE